MSVAAIFSERIAARRAQRQLGPFLTQEYLRIMRSRTAMFIWAMMIYALLALPFIMQNPQPELVHAIATWLGTVSYLNPFFDGVVLIGSLNDYGIWEIIWPILLLVGFNLVVAAIGRRRATVVLEER
jgi:hypothetical protein